ncbi:ABC transporter [Pseudobacillus wudalianchiensis]|uniref:ABC transporter n=1 Tax=Pseudobacillus wudalianchiensis TaxID=1743143 RepID=A0A1B9B9T9_9BACI|nr:ABC transporter [Bacillus wudalianchiensis]OCA92857.1 ABC transporter [Bacillus wudalianchiensis]
MSNGLFAGGILHLFLGFLTGVIGLLLAVLGVLTQLFTLLSLTGIGGTLTLLIAILCFLASLLFGGCLFLRVWCHCCGRKSGC